MNSEPSWSESSARLYRALEKEGVDPDGGAPRVSRCCHAPVGVAGKGSTHWYACGKCGEATDPVPLTEPKDLE